MMFEWGQLITFSSAVTRTLTFREFSRKKAHFTAFVGNKELGPRWNQSIKRLSRSADKKKVNFNNGENNACVFMTGLNIINPARWHDE